MTKDQEIAISRYASAGSKRVSGWFLRVDAEIFRCILTFQSSSLLSGAVAEIGVHHGQSFIQMCLGLNHGEKGYCIDVFDRQDLNIDRSGHGDKEAFLANMRHFQIDLARIVIDSRSSMDVSSTDVLTAAGEVRFFSVDGGHWLEIVGNDLELAAACLKKHGVIALDDFMRAEWPEVSAGYFSWQSSQHKTIVPFAIGGNKLYLCERSWVVDYHNILYRDAFLMAFLTKRVALNGFEIPVFQEFPNPNWSARKRVLHLLKAYYPGFFVRMRSVRRSGRGK